jgi:SWI/SNF-related matrix-associated actin-dependent regulator of chromatin subfamily A3
MLILRHLVESKLKADRVPLKKRAVAAPKAAKAPVEPSSRKKLGYKSSQGSSSQPDPAIPQPEMDLSHFVAHSERFNPREVDKMAEELGEPEEVLSKMLMAAQPKALESTLLPYQRQGLAWMLEKESPVLPKPGSEEVVQLWTPAAGKAGVYRNIATNYCDKNPTVAKGGILADDMGLGKTLQVISLILEGGPGTTLIIAPVSVMSNWPQQMERHIKDDKALKVFTYHGANKAKKMTSRELGEYDVVVTSYGTLVSELFRGTKVAGKVPAADGLFSMNWRRIVLDEGHQIRNPNTKAAIATSSVLAESRWVLTGTPIVNSIKDFYSMLKFLGISGGLQQLEIFNAVFTRPL